MRIYRQIPFIVWIGDTDHFDNTNFLVESTQSGQFQIWAIDFEEGFDWEERDKNGRMVGRWFKNNILFKNRYSNVIELTIERIEALDDFTLQAACETLLGEIDGSQVARRLMENKSSLRNDCHDWLE